MPPITNAYTDFATLIRTRRAIRRYRPDPVPRELIETVLATAVYAPSAHNRQPWRFAILTLAEDKARLAQAMGQQLRSDRLADGDPPAAIEQDVRRSYDRLTTAPVLIIVCLSLADMDTYPDPRRQAAEEVMAVQSVAMAGQTLWLLAHAAGLGACWLCAPLFVPAVVRQTLALPADWQPQGLLTLGWPADAAATIPPKPRRPWSEVTQFL